MKKFRLPLHCLIDSKQTLLPYRDYTILHVRHRDMYAITFGTMNLIPEFLYESIHSIIWNSTIRIVWGLPNCNKLWCLASNKLKFIRFFFLLINRFRFCKSCHEKLSNEIRNEYGNNIFIS
jgi:hypothetical protein